MSKYMPMLSGKVGLVTGASRGIGRDIAIALAGEGAIVALNYRKSQDEAEVVVREITSKGGQAIKIRGDSRLHEVQLRTPSGCILYNIYNPTTELNGKSH